MDYYVICLMLIDIFSVGYSIGSDSSGRFILSIMRFTIFIPVYAHFIMEISSRLN